jgi:hypothetical protein
MVAPRAVLFAIVLAAGLSCTRSELPEPVPVLPPSYRPLVGAADPLWVEPGYAWVGNVEFHANTGDVRPVPCVDHAFANGYGVAGFFLDVDEVRGIDYAACVSAGACPNVDMELDLAATLAPHELEAYCAFRGGRLPLASELARASAGDGSGITTDAFFEAWLACDDTFFEGEGCASLSQRAPQITLHERTWRLPIRSDALDVGPYGHWDLFGSQIEITATYDGLTFEDRDMPACEYPDWFLETPSKPRPAPDPAMPETPDDVRLAHAPAWALAERQGLRAGLPERVIPYWLYGNSRFASLHGGRCAYDPVYELEGISDE